MKQFIACVLLSVVCYLPLRAQYAKLSPYTKMYLQKMGSYGKLAPVPGYVYKTINNKRYISAMAKVNENLSEASLDAIGVKVGTKAGNVWTLQLPADNVNAITSVPGVEYLQVDEPMVYAMDSARITTRVDSVHSGIGLPMPFSGKDVVVGVIDAGFDYRHPTFFDTTGTKFRVKRVWEQKTAGTPPAGFAYGNELTDSIGMWTAGTDNVTFSHGSHVAGIAGGSGFASDTANSRFRGMAYQSDLAFVGIMPDPNQWIETGVSDVIDGMSYLFNYAASVSKPCVVNLSWGTTLGPHDGTSLFSQACDNLTGIGKIFVLSAGNNGGERVHLRKTFTTTDTLVNTRVGFDATLNPKRTWIDIWGDTGQQFCIKLTLYSGLTPYTNTGYFCLDDNIHNLTLVGPNHDTCFITITTSTSEFNHKTRAFLDIYTQSSGFLILSAAATSGTVDMWEGYVANGRGYYGKFSTIANLPAASQGDAEYTIGDIADTRSAITAAAYTSKNIYTGVNNVTTNYTTYAPMGAIAPFSSTGPTVDGRIKPDITSPGLILGSAVNSYDSNYYVTGPYYSDIVRTWHNPLNNRDYGYGMMMGTSMSSPATAGIIALMLEANPLLTPIQVRAILYANAIQDSYTGVIPAGGSTTWGGGKINAYRSVLDAVNHTTGLHNASNSNIQCIVYPNPNEGSFSIGYYSRASETLRIDVLDVAGRTVFSTYRNVVDGYNVIPVAMSLGKGIYFLRVANKFGNTVIKTVIR